MKTKILSAGGLELEYDLSNGRCIHLSSKFSTRNLWGAPPATPTFRDDLTQRTLIPAGTECLDKEKKIIIKHFFKDSPIILLEEYEAADDCIHWRAEAVADKAFRSSGISFHLPMPEDKDVFKTSVWAARENLPQPLHCLMPTYYEYGSLGGGINIPALIFYRKDIDCGFITAMPFDFKTPCLKFFCGYRESEFRIEFDNLALGAGKTAKCELMFKATPGDWRPGLGWLYEKYINYFEPRSHLIKHLWGGHVCGSFDISENDASKIAELSGAWYEIHRHFPEYGNYLPEKINHWPAVDTGDITPVVSTEIVRRTIQRLHQHNIAAFPYFQVSGDAAPAVKQAFQDSVVQSRTGEIYNDHYMMFQMNSDPSLSYGKEIDRQMTGLLNRYKDSDGLFIDQSCYNWADLAHDDGITAINNKPVYMTGFNYQPHLEKLSTMLHPDKAIIGNGVFSVSILKYYDAVMAEGNSWMLRHLQYYAIGSKPLFMLVYGSSDRTLESMFQQCLLAGAGFTSYPKAMQSKYLYEQYVPLLKMLYGRRWIFDPDPLKLPEHYQGNIFRSESGSILVSAVSMLGRKKTSATSQASLKTADSDKITKIYLYVPGVAPSSVPFQKNGDIIYFDLPDGESAVVLEFMH